jgi:hypothetical protein
MEKNQEQFKLDCDFVHTKLVTQLLDNITRQIAEQRIANFTQAHPGGIGKTFINNVFTEAVLEILKTQQTESLEVLLLKKEELRNGTLVWIEQDFNFKGTINAKTEFEKTGKAAYAAFHTKLQRYEDLKVGGRFNTEHLFGESSTYNLTGKKTVFMLAYIQDSTADEINLRPIFIGRKMIATGSGFDRTTDHLQLYVDDIDEFNLVRKISRASLKIEQNENYPEKTIKYWFGELMHEGNIPKDWGGEKSDLFSDHIHINGKRYNAAFMFKGPAKFSPMTINHLGSRGNQIVNLYDEPAEIYFLHHCHYVRTEIHKFMRAFSGQFNRMTRYCIIDGIDTLRVLKAYQKI